MKTLLRPVSYVLVLLLAASCNVTKHLPPGVKLFAGTVVNLHSDEGKKTRKAVKSELEGLVRPKPNASILGFRYKVWIYYLAGDPKGNGKGLRNSLRRTIRKSGEAPVYASDVNFEKNRSVLENRLQNKGFFQASLTTDSSVKGKLFTLKYDAVAGPQYHIRNIMWPSDSSSLSKEIAHSKRRTLLKSGDAYSLDVVKAERDRIDLDLKNHGYYYFNADYLIVKVDSTIGGHQVDYYLQLKPTTPYADREQYRINNIWVYPNYSIQKDSLLGAAPAERFQYFNIIDPEHKFKPKTFTTQLVFKPGEVYSRRDHNRSLSRLVNLGVFRFVKARFEEVDTAGYYLDPYYFLTPLPKKSLRAEITGLTKSDNATGTEVSLAFKNRNLLRGAEQLTVSIFGGLESQVAGNQAVLTDRYGIEANLYFPRIIAPFRLNTNSDFVSKTRINLRAEIYNRNTEYTLQSYRGSYGFLWKENIRKEHQFNVINLNYVQPLNITDSFQHVIDTNIILRRSIEPQFILGPSYNFNFNTLAAPNNRKNNWYFNGNVDAPGNILGLVINHGFNPENQGSLLSTPFAQYVRFEAEGRHYLSLGGSKANVLASRLLGGIGIPYGNSTTMPFIKEFFAGGTNDIRAFRARSLGPGTYYARNYDVGGIIPDQPGDIKIEANTELRGKLVSIVDGAAFIDAGNIWTIHDDASRPGAKFSSNWLQQMAIGAGLGIRLDISFLILRVDLATPIRKPYLPGGPAFVFDQFNFGDKQWRRDNLILNLALGYPF